MNKEEIRLSLNRFLKMYFNACREVYAEINFDRITKIQFKYLKAIKRLEKTTITELSDEFKTSKPTMTEVINKFEKSGLVQKERNEQDKRITYITLTEIGETLATTNVLESRRAVEKMLERLGEDEIITITEIFNRFGDDEE